MSAQTAEWETWRGASASVAPAVSVIVPAGEEDRDLDLRLPSAVHQSVVAHEIVVIDSSSDGRHFAAVSRVEEAAPHAVIRYLRTHVSSPAAVRALGASVAAGNVRAFIGAGTVLPSAWIERLVGALRGLRGPLAVAP